MTAKQLQSPIFQVRDQVDGLSSLCPAGIVLPVSPTSSYAWLAHLAYIITCLPSLCWVCLLSLILLSLGWCQLFKVKVEGRGFCLEWPEGGLQATLTYTHCSCPAPGANGTG